MGMFVKLDPSVFEAAKKSGSKRDTSWMPDYVANIKELIEENVPGSYVLDEGETKGTIRNRLLKAAEFLQKSLHFVRTSTSKDGVESLRFEVIELADKPAPKVRGPRKNKKSDVIDLTNIPELVTA